jgi:hypothetical protein
MECTQVQNHSNWPCHIVMPSKNKNFFKLLYPLYNVPRMAKCLWYLIQEQRRVVNVRRLNLNLFRVYHDDWVRISLVERDFSLRRS